MKTCVLFPHAFTYKKYIDGSVAHAMNSNTALELNLDLSEKTIPGSTQKLRSRLSLFTSHSNSEPKKKAKLLHVEDSPQIRLLVSISLKDEFDIVSVENGEDAIKEIQSESYDLILMDINLGHGMDGFETTRKIREHDDYTDTPIIALTTNDLSQVRKECISSRMNAYIQKPFDKSCLLGTIREINKHEVKLAR
ncbi:MAG: response regulator [Balneolaceae bacterium]|nr:response regulator [Balneolaceae bacterium]